jgi:hypothetical protein
MGIPISALAAHAGIGLRGGKISSDAGRAGHIAVPGMLNLNNDLKQAFTVASFHFGQRFVQLNQDREKSQRH